MNVKPPHIIRILLFLLIAFSGIKSYAQVTIEVELIVPLQLQQEPLIMSMDYDNWDPGNKSNVLTKIDKTHYRITLKNNPSVFEYKFTQGSWMSVEG